MTIPTRRQQPRSHRSTSSRRRRHPSRKVVLLALSALVIVGGGLGVTGRDVITQATAHELEVIHAMRHTAHIIALGFRPGTDLFLTLDGVSTLRSWDLKSGDLISETDLAAGKLATGAFSPDMRWLASGASYDTIRLWDLTNEGKPFTLGERKLHHKDGLLAGLEALGRWPTKRACRSVECRDPNADPHDPSPSQ